MANRDDDDINDNDRRCRIMCDETNRVATDDDDRAPMVMIIDLPIVGTK